jgi:hypothetical protein
MCDTLNSISSTAKNKNRKQVHLNKLSTYLKVIHRWVHNYDKYCHFTVFYILNTAIKYLRKRTYRNKDLFWLSFRGFSPLLPDCCFRAGEAEHYGRKHVLEESSSPHVQEAEKEKDQD